MILNYTELPLTSCLKPCPLFSNKNRKPPFSDPSGQFSDPPLFALSPPHSETDKTRNLVGFQAKIFLLPFLLLP